MTPAEKLGNLMLRDQAHLGTSRYVVYHSAEAKTFLCTVMARDRRHALKIARQTFLLSKTAYARREGR